MASARAAGCRATIPERRVSAIVRTGARTAAASARRRRVPREAVLEAPPRPRRSEAAGGEDRRPPLAPHEPFLGGRRPEHHHEAEETFPAADRRRPEPRARDELGPRPRAPAQHERGRDRRAPAWISDAPTRTRFRGSRSERTPPARSTTASTTWRPARTIPSEVAAEPVADRGDRRRREEEAEIPLDERSEATGERGGHARLA